MQSGVDMYWVGLFLRFGVPLGLTLMLAWLLKNIDLQWLENAKDEIAESGGASSDMPGCWIYHNLSQENNKFQDLKAACWKVRVKFEGSLPEECLECVYFGKRLLENVA